MIPLGKRTLRVIGVRYVEEEATVLIVEDMTEPRQLDVRVDGP
jgi:hypothetical protein